jgi:hypothetical protein
VLDPFAGILRDDIYWRLTLPDPGPLERVIQQLEHQLAQATPDVRRQMLQRVEHLRGYFADVASSIRAVARR